MTDAPPLAVLAPSPLRRVFAVAVLAGMGALLAWLALSAEGGAGARLILAASGALALVMAEAVRRAGRRRLELTAEGLRDSGGRILAPMEAIARVERGPFVVKPSGGFVVHLATGAPRAWVPGLWWRLGRRVGVGGITSTHQARAMADRLTILLAERESG